MKKNSKLECLKSLLKILKKKNINVKATQVVVDSEENDLVDCTEYPIDRKMFNKLTNIYSKKKFDILPKDLMRVVGFLSYMRDALDAKFEERDEDIYAIYAHLKTKSTSKIIKILIDESVKGGVFDLQPVIDIVNISSGGKTLRDSYMEEFKNDKKKLQTRLGFLDKNPQLDKKLINELTKHAIAEGSRHMSRFQFN